MKVPFVIGSLTLTLNLLLANSPSYKQSTGNSCFKSREMLYPLEETFDALKQTLMQSNLNIVTVTKNDGVLTAKGNQYNRDEETIIGVTITVDFKERIKDTTSVKVIASYETIAKKNDTGQIGGGGISLPIPVPFTGKYTLVGQGNIDDSTWYRGFFNSLEKILFEHNMKYGKSTINEAKEITKETIDAKKDIPQVEMINKEITPSKLENQKAEDTKEIKSQNTQPIETKENGVAQIQIPAPELQK
jgi:hypothetical protein